MGVFLSKGVVSRLKNEQQVSFNARVGLISVPHPNSRLKLMLRVSNFFKTGLLAVLLSKSCRFAPRKSRIYHY